MPETATEDSEETDALTLLAGSGGDAESAGFAPADPAPTKHGRNYSWAELMKRVWAIDVLECPRCGYRMRMLTSIHPPETTRKILDCLGLPSRAPPIAHAASELTSVEAF